MRTILSKTEGRLCVIISTYLDGQGIDNHSEIAEILCKKIIDDKVLMSDVSKVADEMEKYDLPIGPVYNMITSKILEWAERLRLNF
jgi:hypothetical protein